MSVRSRHRARRNPLVTRGPGAFKVRWPIVVIGAGLIVVAIGLASREKIMQTFSDLKIKEILKQYAGIPFSSVPLADRPPSIVKVMPAMSAKEQQFLAGTPINQIFDIGTLYKMNPDTVQARSVARIADTPAEFIAKVKGPAIAAIGKYPQLGIDPRILVAQAAHEGGWGKSAVGGTNIFGHIATPNWSSAGGKYSYASTFEVVNGKEVPAYRPFRMYDSLDEAFRAHAAILSASRYSGARGISDPYTWGYTIAKSGYATANPEKYGKAVQGTYSTVVQNW